MWRCVRRAGVVTALALPCSLLAVQSAFAALGGSPMTPPSDASVSSRTVQPSATTSGTGQGVAHAAASAASSTSATATSYTVRETAFPNGTKVREYLAADGSVFGIAWRGPQMPDLDDLLGTYFPQYVSGVKAARAARGGGHGPVTVSQSNLVVNSGGHMGAFNGQAYLPSSLPAGVSGTDIQ